MNTALHNRLARKKYPLVIYDKTAEEVVGMTRVYELNSDQGYAKIGHTWVSPGFHGAGLNQGCKYILLEFLFEKIKLHRIGFGISASNNKSIAAIEKIGARWEGALREFLPGSSKDTRIDLNLYGILTGEWTDRVQQHLGRIIETKFNALNLNK